jgi:uncharacterized protein (DUF1330 family)
MVAYVIFTREKTRDPAELEIYRQKAPAGFANHAPMFRAGHGRFKVVEGPDAEDVLILEFASFEDATAWYNDPVYRDACAHRFKGADYRCIIDDGL